MSNATNSGDRMTTRGDAKGKMSKVMAIVRSGGIEDSDLPEDGKTAKKSKKSKGVKKSPTGTEDAGTSKNAKTSKNKAVDARSSHPRRWTVDSEDSRAKAPDSESENDGVDETAEHNEPSSSKRESGCKGSCHSGDAETANADETGANTDKIVKASSNSKSAHAVATRPIHKETQKPDKGPLSNYGLEGDSDDDEESDSDGQPPKNSKKKAAGKKKKKGTKAKLIREQIKSNRKLVTEAQPSLENGGKQTFDIPDTKKNINASVANWRHRLSPPNSPPPDLKKQKVLSVKAGTIVSKVTSKAKSTSAKSASCAIVSTSTSNVLAKPARRAKRRYEELESASDASDEVEGMALGGMDDDYDDALEQAAAVLSPLRAPAAAQKNKKSLDIRTGIASPHSNKETEEAKQQWSGVFIPTFLRYLGGMEKDIWAFKRQNAVHVLQAIWNTVYAGSTNGSMSKIKHLVEIGGAVHEVSVQRATEWRNAIGATGLSVVGDFMDSTGLDTTEARREAADQLLADERAGTSCSLALGHGYISKESYDAALSQKKSGILKVLGPDGKCTKTTNFSKEQWEEISDIHVRDVWSVEQEKLQVIRGDINKAVDQIRNRKPTKRRATAYMLKVIPKRKLSGTLLAIETVIGRTFKFST
ncbi:hypothetical protein EDB86DRAFT_3076798 [Lactarius hatsudake]|nr:hypothetical protein EDB86DRAFT_3076798 [Lactarius hatsudake]